MKPSHVFDIYKSGRRMAARTGQTFALDNGRLQNMGLTMEQIESVCDAVERLEAHRGKNAL